MNNSVLYARFSPQPVICPTCQTRMSKMLGLDAFECSTCGHVASLGDGTHGSIQAQLEQCRTYCERQKYEIIGEYYDEALSGASLERPGLDAAIDALKRGDILVVHMLDRLTRDAEGQWVGIEKRIYDKKARYESVSGEGTQATDNQSWLSQYIIRGFNHYNRLEGNRRTSEMMIAHQKSGRRMTPKNKVPFGMMTDPDNPKKLITNPQEQGVIKTIVAVYADVLLVEHRGNGYREVARRIKKRGIKARHGGTISHNLVTDVIKKYATV